MELEACSVSSLFALIFHFLLPEIVSDWLLATCLIHRNMTGPPIFVIIEEELDKSPSNSFCVNASQH